MKNIELDSADESVSPIKSYSSTNSIYSFRKVKGESFSGQDNILEEYIFFKIPVSYSSANLWITESFNTKYLQFDFGFSVFCVVIANNRRANYEYENHKVYKAAWIPNKIIDKTNTLQKLRLIISVAFIKKQEKLLKSKKCKFSCSKLYFSF